MPTVKVGSATIKFPDDMAPEEIAEVVRNAMQDFRGDLQTAKDHLKRLADGSVIVSTLRDMKPRDQAALATSMIPGVGDAIGVNADLQDMGERWSDAPWYDKAAMVGGTAMGALPFVPSRSQVKGATEVANKITAYHGSPHDFGPVTEIKNKKTGELYELANVDKTGLDNHLFFLDKNRDDFEVVAEHPLGRFSMSKIGTGEGAQAYGHGLYFAESEDVAREYRDKLATGHRGVAKEDTIADTLVNQNSYMDDLETFIDHAEFNAIETDVVMANGKNMVVYRFDDGSGIEFDNSIYDQTGSVDDSISAVDVGGSGRMYQVEIDATPDELLDWDLPLSEQPEAIQKAWREKNKLTADDEALLLELGDVSPEGAPSGDVSGMQIYHDLVESAPVKGAHGSREDFANAYDWASKSLRDKGIKGIRYKDGFSRGAEGGTSNYVIFDDRLISISKKYGIAIPAAAAMLARQTGEDAESMYREDA